MNKEPRKGVMVDDQSYLKLAFSPSSHTLSLSLFLSLCFFPFVLFSIFRKSDKAVASSASMVVMALVPTPLMAIVMLLLNKIIII